MLEAKVTKMDNVIRDSKLICPRCGYSEVLEMPTDACLWFHECSGCHVLLKPTKGDCCVFCSYGSIPCPPIQLQKMGHGGSGGHSTGGCCG